MNRKINERCPLQSECERKCTYEHRERECPYYIGNNRPGCELLDQASSPPNYDAWSSVDDGDIIPESAGQLAEVVQFPGQHDYSVLAKEKLAQELKDFKGGSKEKAVSSFVASTLTKFSEESERFAEVVCKTRRTLSDCCEEIMRDCGSSISDIDVYRAAAKFYFPNSEVEFKMEIAFTGAAPSEEEMAKVPEKKPATKKRAPSTKLSNKTAKPAKQDSRPSQPAVPPKKQAKTPPETIQLTLF